MNFTDMKVLNTSNDELIEAFNMIDSDQGGEISLEELRVAMQSADCGVTKPEMEYLFRKVSRRIQHSKVDQYF